MAPIFDVEFSWTARNVATQFAELIRVNIRAAVGACAVRVGLDPARDASAVETVFARFESDGPSSYGKRTYGAHHCLRPFSADCQQAQLGEVWQDGHPQGWLVW